jgi:hypothetical protein
MIRASKSRSTTTAYFGHGMIRLAPLACPYCRYELTAHEVEQLSGDEYRLICPACHRDLFAIERQ